MKNKLQLLFLFTSAMIYGQAVATLPAYEGFDYDVDSKLIEDDQTIGVGYWSNSQPRGTDIKVKNQPTGLDGTPWGDLPGIKTPEGLAIKFVGSGENPEFLFTPQTGQFGKIYTSFLIKLNDIANLVNPNSRFISLAYHDGTGLLHSTSVFVKKLDDVDGEMQYNLGVGKSTDPDAVIWDTTVYTNEQIMIVIYHDDTNSITDTKMWINPDPTAAEPMPTVTDGPNVVNVDRVRLYQHSTTNTPNMKFDELRVGKTWAEVTNPSTLSISDLDVSNLKIYPNPVSNGKLFINSNSNNEKEVTIYNLLGQEVFQTKMVSNLIDVSEIARGAYIIKIADNNSR